MYHLIFLALAASQVFAAPIVILLSPESRSDGEYIEVAIRGKAARDIYTQLEVKEVHHDKGSHTISSKKGDNISCTSVSTPGDDSVKPSYVCEMLVVKKTGKVENVKK